jgi:hypothetical protein
VAALTKQIKKDKKRIKEIEAVNPEPYTPNPILSLGP